MYKMQLLSINLLLNVSFLTLRTNPGGFAALRKENINSIAYFLNSSKLKLTWSKFVPVVSLAQPSDLVGQIDVSTGDRDVAPFLRFPPPK